MIDLDSPKFNRYPIGALERCLKEVGKIPVKLKHRPTVDRWLWNLRSEAYAQVTGTMHMVSEDNTHSGYCALGVYINICKGNQFDFPCELIRLVTNLNDNYLMSFPLIADILEDVITWDAEDAQTTR